MNFLLDTHTLIWSITEKNKLSSKALKTLENPDNSIFVSAITFWEISIKFSLGKLELKGFSSDELPNLAIQTGFQLISIPCEESAFYHKLEKTNHRDPFDRMLIWQAINRNLILVTKDGMFDQYISSGLKTYW